MTVVRVARERSSAVLELARPETGNALDAAMVEELTAALAELRGSDRRTVVLTGAGANFCSGADLASLAALAQAPPAARLADARHLATLYASLLRCPLVTLAAVCGAAYGGGLGLAAACDLVIAAPDVRLQFSELRLGFVPALISVFLPRRLPPASLARLFLDPSPLDGAAGRAAGLVDEVADDPLAAALARADEIAARTSPAAVAETKRLLLAHTVPQLDQQLAEAARVNAEQRAHPECRRGVAHFLETRKFPDWLER